MLKLKKIKPMFTALITTMDKYEQDELTSGGLIDTTRQQGTLKEIQRVISVGSCVRDIKEGDLVAVNPTRFAVRKHQAGSLKDGIIEDNPITKYEFETIVLDGERCLVLQDRDINFIVEDYEEVENPKPTLKLADSIIV